MKEFIWTTKDGQKLKLNEIGDKHLFYICRMLYRQLNECRELESFGMGAFAPQGEIASMDFENALVESYMLAGGIQGALKHIEPEMKKRDLELPKMPKNKSKEMNERVISVEEGFMGCATLIKLK